MDASCHRADGVEPIGGRPPALVTGGAGFIGCHLVRLLLERGHRVRVIDLQRSPGLDRRAEFVEGSVLDRALLRAALGGVEWVFNLAGNPNLWTADSSDFLAANYEGTRAVIEAAGRSSAKRLVHTSSESVLIGHRRGDDIVVDERAPSRLDDMRGAYCRSKLLGERAALEAAGRGLPAIVVNPTMPVGPGDHRVTPPTRMLLDFLDGEHLAYFDFEMNLVDVRDAALGHLLAAERGRVGQRYLLGGANVRLSQILAILGDITGLSMPRYKIPYAGALAFAALSETIATYVTRRPPKATLSGVRLAGAEMRVDCSKAMRELGYTPRRIQDALADAVAWLDGQGRMQRPLHRRTTKRPNAADPSTSAAA
jgi:dihydroflavonol-4-reductase